MNRSHLTSLGMVGRWPAPVCLHRLREHFRQVYMFNEDQVELMLRSASQSLRTNFAAADRALAGGDPCTALAAVAHSLNGLLLNLGEGDWAVLARNIEQAARAGRGCGYAEVVGSMREGLSAIAEYDGC